MAKTGPKPSMKVGFEVLTNSGWRGVVTEYKDAHNVTVKWQDGSSSVHSAVNIRNGGIKPLYQPSVYGVGYSGYGKYVPLSYKRKEDWQEYVDERVYFHWVKMLQRTYGEDRPSNKTYYDCEVVEDWFNFQNFALWAENQPYKYEEDSCLDKDILIKGNRLYSPETCCFLPNIINVFISSNYHKESGLPEGVNVIAPKTKNSKIGYVARCHFLGNREYLGYFDCPVQAGEVYYKRKIEAGEALAAKYKGLIRDDAVDNLLKHYRRD